MITGNKMDNCLDGDFVFQYAFDTQWTRDAIQALKTLGQLRYYDSFPRPMFQLSCSDGTIVKGVQGTDECRVIFARDDPDGARRRLEKRLAETINSF